MSDSNQPPRGQTNQPALKFDGSVSNSETHGGEDVALYASGAGAEGVRGVIEQNLIFDIMMSAYGWSSAK